MDLDDNDDFMTYDGDENYEFEYEDDDEDLMEADGENGNPDNMTSDQIEMENSYYAGKSKKETEPIAAMEWFKSVLDTQHRIAVKKGSSSDEIKTEWGFKALKQLVKLASKLGDFGLMVQRYRELLQYMPLQNDGTLTRNYVEKSLNNLLEYVSVGSKEKSDSGLETFYQLTLDAIEKDGNERLAMKTNLNLAKIFLDRQDFVSLAKTLRFLREHCKIDNTSFDDLQRKGTHLLEIYALEIQMYTQTKNYKKLKEVYQRCLAVKTAIPHPRIMGIVRECGGKMHIIQKQWDQAQQDFFEAFKNYDEAGSPQRIRCLKYLVLANMLTESSINPFDSQETSSYKSHPELIAMMDMVIAFQEKDIIKFQRVLQDNQEAIMSDPFIRNYLEEVLKSIRSQVILNLVGDGQDLDLNYITESLGGNTTLEGMEQLVIELILDGKIEGRIDMISKKLVLEPSQARKSGFMAPISNWCDSIDSMANNICRKLVQM